MQKCMNEPDANICNQSAECSNNAAANQRNVSSLEKQQQDYLHWIGSLGLSLTSPESASTILLVLSSLATSALPGACCSQLSPLESCD